MLLLRLLKVGRRYESRVVYKWGSTEGFESASVSKDIGCRYRGSYGGHYIATEHGVVLPNLRQWIHD
jgi:hypothetical protein